MSSELDIVGLLWDTTIRTRAIVASSEEILGSDAVEMSRLERVASSFEFVLSIWSKHVRVMVHKAPASIFIQPHSAMCWHVNARGLRRMAVSPSCCMRLTAALHSQFLPLQGLEQPFRTSL
jgi:hypothetical protein